MDQEAVVKMLHQLREEKAEHDQRGAALDRAITGLAELLGREGSTDSRTPPPKRRQPSGSKYPRGTEAVRRVLVETGRELDIREITEELIQRGWTPQSSDPVNATSSAAARAAEILPEITRRRKDNGAYAYRHEIPAPTPPPDSGLDLNGSTPPSFEEVVTS